MVAAGIEIVSDKLACEAFVHDFEMLIEACISRTGNFTIFIASSYSGNDEIVVFLHRPLGFEDL